MRALALVVVLVGCGVPPDEDEVISGVKVGSDALRSWSVRLGGDRCTGACELPAPPADSRLPLIVEGVTDEGRTFTVDRDVWLPAGRELVAIDVHEAEVRLHFIDPAPPPGISLSGLRLMNSGSRAMIAFGGCALHALSAGGSLELDCLSSETVGLQLEDAVATDVTLTTTYVLQPDERS